MTAAIASQCFGCKNLDTSTVDELSGRPELSRCAAFPGGIPDDMLFGGDHRELLGGEDDGIVFELADSDDARRAFGWWTQVFGERRPAAGSKSSRRSRAAVSVAIRDLTTLRDRLSGATRAELDGILVLLERLAANPSAKHGNHDQRSHGRRRTGTLGNVLDKLESLKGKLSDDDRSVLEMAMAQLRNLESSDVDDDDLIEDEPDTDALTMDSVAGSVAFIPYTDGTVDVEWDEGSYGMRLSQQSAGEVADAVARFADLPVAEGMPDLPPPPDWVTDEQSFVRWRDQLTEQWDASDAGRRYNGIAGDATTSDGELKIVRYGTGVTHVGDPEVVDSESATGALSLDDPGEANQFADLLRQAMAIASPEPAGKSHSKGAPMATKSFNPTIKAVDESGTGTATLKIASFGEVDKDGDVTERGYFGTQYVQFVPTHNWDHVWLGKGKVYEKADGAYCDVKFNLKIPAARDWYEAIKFDYENPPALAEYSYGYHVLPGGSKSGQHQGRQVRYLIPREDGSPGADVFEVSPVMMGAGTGTGTASVKSAARRPAVNEPSRPRAIKGAIPEHETKTVSRAWDRTRTEAALPDDLRPSELRSVYAYVDPDGDPELKSSYAWPHHHGVNGPANLRACLMGIAQLNGPAGADMGEVERKGIYQHLAAHLKDADRDVPDLRTGPGDASKSRFADEAAMVLASVSGLIDRASDVMAMRRTKGKGMAAGTADLLGWVSDEVVRLKHLLSNPVEPEVPQPDDEEIASVIAASVARIHGMTPGA